MSARKLTVGGKGSSRKARAPASHDTLAPTLEGARQTIDELIENCPAVIHVKDLDGKFLFVNTRYEEVVGTTREDVIGRSVFDVYPAAMAELANKRDLEVIGSVKSITEETVVTKGSAQRVFLDVKFPLFDQDGAVRGTAGIAIEITELKRLQEALTVMANTDVLTGLANRRCFIEKLAHEFSRGQRYANPLAVMCFDLDHFKAINDRHGHAMGDMALKGVAEVFRKALRSLDVAGRLGGEEFAIFMPETDAAEAVEVSERLRDAIAKMDLRTPGGDPLAITVSVGVSCVQGDDADHEAVLARADAALYKAKSEGRNRVCHYMSVESES